MIDSKGRTVTILYKLTRLSCSIIFDRYYLQIICYPYRYITIRIYLFIDENLYLYDYKMISFRIIRNNI